MGAEQSIPATLFEEDELTTRPLQGSPGPKRRGRETRSLFWRMVPHMVTVRLHADVALCFGDVARVLLILHRDDAELDEPLYPSLHHGYTGDDSGATSMLRHSRNGQDRMLVDSFRHDEVAGRDGDLGHDAGGRKMHRGKAREWNDKLLHQLHPHGYKRLRFWNGIPEEGENALPHVIFQGVQLSPRRQISGHSGMQRDSTLHFIMPTPSSPWRTLPRPLNCSHSGKEQKRGCWALPAGWDQDLRAAVANHDSLQLSGRSDLIASYLHQIEAHPSMRIITRPSFNDLCQYGRPTEAGSGKKSASASVNELLANITDGIHDPPLDVFIALKVPPESALYGKIGELVVHMQMPPLYPLAPERYRMITPILHPLVTPHWDDGILFAPGNIQDDQDQCQKRDDGWAPGAGLDGGRMAFVNEQTYTQPVQLLSWFLTTLDHPDQFARQLLVTHPNATPRIHSRFLRQWTTVRDCCSRAPDEAPVDEEAGKKAKRQRTEQDRMLVDDGDAMCIEDGTDRVGGLPRSVQLMGQFIKNGMRWHPDTHAVFPRAFKDEVRCLLMVRHRSWWQVPMEVIWIIIDALLRAHLTSHLLHA